MEFIVPIFVFLAVVLAVVVFRWLYVRDRMARMESSIAELKERLDAQSEFVAQIYRGRQAPAQTQPVAPPPPEPEPVRPVARGVEAPRVQPPRVVAPRVEPAPIALPTPPPAPQPAAAPREWETILGGNWL